MRGVLFLQIMADEHWVPPPSLERIAAGYSHLAWTNYHLHHESPAAQQLAKPLLDAGFLAAAITRRQEHCGGLHRVKEHRFTLLLGGDMRVVVGEKEYKLDPGQLVYCPPGTLFRRWQEGEAWWIYLDFFPRPVWQSLEEQGPYVRDHTCPDLVFILLHQLREMDYIWQSGRLAGDSQAAQADRFLAESTPRGVKCARLLLDILMEMPANTASTPDRQVRWLHDLVQQIRLAPHRQWDNETMCRTMHVSKSTLARLMLREYNLSPLQMVIQARMDRAIECLRDSHNSIADIAKHVGYQSSYSFSRLFTKHMGMSPSRYREKVLGKK